MDIIDEIEFDCPSWAVIPIEYRDYSGLTEEDEQILQNWMQTLKREGATWEIVFTSDTNEFNPHPAFGLACATCKARIVYFRK